MFLRIGLTTGVKSASDLFHHVMIAMLNDLTGTDAFTGDIIISSEIQDELLNRKSSVFERIQQYGFQAEKCQFFRTSIKYLGFIFDKHGRRSDPEHIAAIKSNSSISKHCIITFFSRLRRPLELIFTRTPP